ncbi:unnamed protein product [Symbiodinium sp. CCMP2592]|nr:unnamed protein product [Symbiodinium sp. CCMP2592]
MPPKGRKAPKTDVDKMRDQITDFSEQNTLSKIQERIEAHPEYIPKALEVVQMLESTNKYSKLESGYVKDLLGSLYGPEWAQWLSGVRCSKKELNCLFKLLSGIAPESALPGRGKASILAEVMIGPPWQSIIVEKGVPSASQSTLPMEFWQSYGWWALSEVDESYWITHISGKKKKVPAEMQVFNLGLKNPGDLENCQVGEGRIWVNVLSLFQEDEGDQVDMPKVRKEMPRA